MLDPRSRTLLLSALKPPTGYELSDAVGTTYTLDLLALLSAPLAFTLYEYEDREGHASHDPLLLLESLRSNAHKISIFCQAGRISIPAQNKPLFGYLEDSIHEVTPLKQGGVFHPKVWILRYVSDNGPIMYRFLCLSRNLTFDRSWDTILMLDGELKDRKNAFSVNHPLGDFLLALQNLTIHSIPETTRNRIEILDHEIRRVEFIPPRNIESVRFWPLGIKSTNTWPFGSSGRRMLVMSPFLSDDFLKRLTTWRTPGIVISRQDSLDNLDTETIELFEHAYVLSDNADPEDAAEQSAETSSEILSGLHAKLFVMDDGWNAKVWTGSANATDAAFSSNIEFLVELAGKKSALGVDALLNTDDNQLGFSDILEPYAPSMDKDDEPSSEVEKLIETARSILIKSGLTLHAMEESTADTYGIHLMAASSDVPRPPDGVSIICWPITLQRDLAVRCNPNANPAADFGSLSWQALTSFVAFELAVDMENPGPKVRFVLNLPVEGGPPDRKERLLRRILKDRNDVLRFLLLILSGDNIAAGLEVLRGDSVSGAVFGEFGSGSHTPLFETLLRALGRDPQRLERVARIVADLRKTEDGSTLLPEGFDAVWDAIWQAYTRRTHV